MDIYHIWFDLKPGADEQAFAAALPAFLGKMKDEGRIETWRMMRCKLGLRPDTIREFHIMIETRDLAQLDSAFRAAAAREGEMDTLHFAANAMVTNVKFGLFRDWPD
ncbi:MAG: DUF6614 family protein [Hyphomonas sp.]|uniref:DUF6614 family protein n=1 Tax=Hyphomonas sp. TaxID=87 RepID=UPI00352801B8